MKRDCTVAILSCDHCPINRADKQPCCWKSISYLKCLRQRGKVGGAVCTDNFTRGEKTSQRKKIRKKDLSTKKRDGEIRERAE